MSLDIRLYKAIAEQQACNYQLAELVAAVNRIIMQTYVFVGFKMPRPEDVALVAAKLAADLQESYPFLTVAEVAICFELGAKGEYGDFMGLNLRTFSRWIKMYQTSDLRYRVIVKRNKALTPALPPVSEAYNRECERNFLESVFEQYRTGTPLDRLYPARVYQSLQQLGVIRNTAAEKWAALDRARTAQQQRRRPKQSLDLSEYQIKQQAMAHLLQAFFDKLISENGRLFAA